MNTKSFTVTGYDDSAVKHICYYCNSKVSRQSYNYFRRLAYVSGDKVWSKVWSKDGEPIGFYYAMRCRTHIRLIEIAVVESHQGKGIGKAILYSLLQEMKKADVKKLTFRTPMNEPAHKFWLHIGGVIMDVKGSDYEMELTIE